MHESEVLRCFDCPLSKDSILCDKVAKLVVARVGILTMEEPERSTGQIVTGMIEILPNMKDMARIACGETLAANERTTVGV